MLVVTGNTISRPFGRALFPHTGVVDHPAVGDGSDLSDNPADTGSLLGCDDGHRPDLAPNFHVCSKTGNQPYGGLHCVGG